MRPHLERTANELTQGDANADYPALVVTTNIVISYFNKFSCEPHQVVTMMRDVHEVVLQAIHREGKNVDADEAFQDEPKERDPAVPIAASITEDHLICLEDGKKLRSLKRYLRTHYSMTPNQYRLKWGLPDDYPMVAPALSRQRSLHARLVQPHFARKSR